MEIKTIADVLIKLNEIIAVAEKTGSRQGYFAVLYKEMTFAVQQGILRNKFTDGPRMEKMDVIFAKRYIDAHEAYALGQKVTNGWQTAFDACKRNDLAVIQHLILGVNTHINLDLAIATAETAPGSAIMDMQADYEIINNIIASLVDDVQDKLTKVWWPLFFIRDIVNNRQDAVINFSIVMARKTAWASAVALANVQGEGREGYINTMDNTVTEVAHRIMKPGAFVNFILTFVKWFESKDVTKNIGLIK